MTKQYCVHPSLRPSLFSRASQLIYYERDIFNDLLHNHHGVVSSYHSITLKAFTRIIINASADMHKVVIIVMIEMLNRDDINVFSELIVSPTAISLIKHVHVNIKYVSST